MASLLGTVDDRSETTDLELAVRDEASIDRHVDSDRFCPECGQSLLISASERERRPTDRALLLWLGLAVAAYILVSSGLAAWSSYRLVHDEEPLLQRRVDVGVEVVIARQSAGPIRSQGFPSAEEAAVYGRTMLDHHINRLVSGGTVGLLALVGIACRRRLGLRALAENVVATFLALSLVMFGYYLVAQLLTGIQPTIGLVLDTASSTVDTWVELGAFVATTLSTRGGLAGA
jgi:hypothetical protein